MLHLGWDNPSMGWGLTCWENSSGEGPGSPHGDQQPVLVGKKATSFQGWARQCHQEAEGDGDASLLLTHLECWVLSWHPWYQTWTCWGKEGLGCLLCEVKLREPSIWRRKDLEGPCLCV